jgi:DNA (cytosine-5)-methyltransferase 1
MKRGINVIDLFSGIGGFSLGLQRAGYEIERHYFSEVNRDAIANYRYDFRDGEYIGSVEDVRGGDFGRGEIDIITFGSPCQDFSLAGKRAGIDGERSGLIREAIRLVREIRPSVFIWENVKGVFSSNFGADFAAILQEFANIGGYRLEWQLLNTRWLLPQNRERIYLVGHLAGRSRAGIFPIGENDSDVVGTKRRTQSKVCTTLRANGAIGRDDTYIYQMNASKESNGRQPYQQNRVYDSRGNVPALNCHKADLIIYQRPRGNNKGGVFTECPTISANSFQENNFVGSIRRLTERECERLQGFPDDWTRWGNYNGEVKEIARTNRYKMIGNSVTVDVVAAVAKRLKFEY